MPIFVSRFSPTRSGLANFQSLRAAVEDVRQGVRASSQENRADSRGQGGDQTASSGEDRTGASPLLANSQRADQIAQSITDQNDFAGGRQAETTSASGETTASAFSSPSQETVQASVFPEVSTTGGAVQAALQNTGEQTAQAANRQTAQATGRQTPQTTSRQTGRTIGRQAAQSSLQNAQENRQTQVQRRELPQDTRVTLRPFLRSAVHRIDGLSRLLSAQRRSEEPTVAAEPAVTADLAVTTEPAAGTDETARALVSTSLRIEQTAAQSSVVRTAQAIQVAEAQQAVQAAQETSLGFAQPPSAEERIQQTTQLKQNLREDMATVTRGLVRDVARQNTQNARKMAQNTFQATAQQARPATTLARPSPQNFLSSSPRRQSFTISNLAPLRSALALLGTNVNILVG
ncbi:MAG: hypothetical protein EXS64_14935 [Candidatus Latescibacteria bacterium]|nr:hypothetical protein [Candidatus Latescibacterota bacterium]